MKIQEGFKRMSTRQFSGGTNSMNRSKSRSDKQSSFKSTGSPGDFHPDRRNARKLTQRKDQPGNTDVGGGNLLNEEKRFESDIL